MLDFPCMGVGRGLVPPWTSKFHIFLLNSKQKRLFTLFRVGTMKFHYFWLPWKNPRLPPHGKNPSDAHDPVRGFSKNFYLLQNCSRSSRLTGRRRILILRHEQAAQFSLRRTTWIGQKQYIFADANPVMDSIENNRHHSKQSPGKQHCSQLFSSNKEVEFNG